MEKIEPKTVKELTWEIESLFPCAGTLDRAYIDVPWGKGARIIPDVLVLRSSDARSERRLLQAMYDAFADAKHALGHRNDVGIMWRRYPHIVPQDAGGLVLRLRMALVDADGQIKVHGLPFKAEGTPSRSID